MSTRPILAVLALLAIGGCGSSATRTPAARPPAPESRPTAPLRLTATAPRAASPRRVRRRSEVVPASIVEHGSRRHRWVALTFDADMTYAMRNELRDGRQRTWVDAALFRELRATHTPATIFLTGLWTRVYSTLVRRLARDPLFELENHSLDHAAWRAPCYGLPTVDTDAARRHELRAAQRIITRVAGVRPRLFRFPGICHTRSDVSLVARSGLRPVDGDVVSTDAFNPDAASIVRAVLAHVHPGSIVIAHCIGAPNTPATAVAIGQLIPDLRARGYRLVTLARLLNLRSEPGGAARAAHAGDR